MTENWKSISQKEFQKLLKEFDEYVQNSVSDAEKEAKNNSAPQLYQENMKGYSRGLYIMGQEIIKRLKSLL